MTLPVVRTAQTGGGIGDLAVATVADLGQHPAKGFPEGRGGHLADGVQPGAPVYA